MTCARHVAIVMTWIAAVIIRFMVIIIIGITMTGLVLIRYIVMIRGSIKILL